LTNNAKRFTFSAAEQAVYLPDMTNTPRAHIQVEICRFLSDMLGQHIAPHDDLRSKGLDSVGFLELIIFLEKQLDIPLPLQLMSGSPVTSVEVLVERIVAIRPTAFDV
jgi:acyl carrier protein